MTSRTKRAPLFGCVKPCANCPYRTDAPVAHWHRDEFKKVLEAETSELGAVFLCHKNTGGVCVGFLMDQDRRNHPSIMLRIEFSRHDVTREYLDRLRCPAPLYPDVNAMVRANFPELLGEDEEGASDE
jgi:hypothetical protein